MIRMTMKAARVNAGLTQKEAAKRFGISNKTLSSWESGTSTPRADQVPAICDCYGVSYNDIIFLPRNPLKGD